MAPNPITCHILDTTTGKPAANVVCSIYKVYIGEGNDDQDQLIETQEAQILARARTNDDGRIPLWVFNPDMSQRKLLATNGIQEADQELQWRELKPGYYKIRFQTGLYFKSQGQTNFHPFVDILFHIDNGSRHYHIPLLLSNYGYTTYKGS
ncbi:hypothetical protein ZYGR_0H03150 [Zygosaccharomyces rouxii]|uniref:5-hydroxyisourate hydrolase n=2 Tax=Zygosaccharomyces rouxii TaxID=4956 RepID=C5DRU1_ZYGRC|nr:uncharacterized protein ZYRO0B11308g [Zygosaccharomyces rouxii]KAH9199967.1 hypothetical protein LQ764DRAFT_227429 [Zygosaccharomyces rouxii]GAV47472.1 hypothetical protein ZYGR_0H03150 [Zygosaccharomyces rouxii]CAR26502.1 ZYRO0B11308p [Zygosaccharomyces rouxii]